MQCKACWESRSHTSIFSTTVTSELTTRVCLQGSADENGNGNGISDFYTDGENK